MSPSRHRFVVECFREGLDLPLPLPKCHR